MEYAMEKGDSVRQEILGVLSVNFGDSFAASFGQAYMNTKLVDFTDSAYAVLADLLGRIKAQEQINRILISNQLKPLSDA